jgi:site-specific DNA recombinase
MNVGIYARFSTDLQNAASIRDQVRLCRARAESEGWTVVATYEDAAYSGTNSLRPAYQRLLSDARTGRLDIVLAEALDRLSRDQEDVAGLYKHLSFAGVELITLAEGPINELHVGLKGTMNALFVKDLARKVRRGLEGRIRERRSGGGLGYGYDLVREYDAKGEPIRGGRKINEEEARIVVRIFQEFALGKSPRAIAKALNAEGMPGPLGRPWGPSTIYGNWRRGTGILNNQLFIGHLVWNRQHFLKDPSTGRRVGRLNPETEWIVEEVQDLRIISDDLWTRVKNRQRVVRDATSLSDYVTRSERARRPAYLLSTLLRCNECGGGFSKRSEHHYGCSNARNRGTCSNLLTIRRDVVEESVLSGLKSHLMDPGLVKEFVAEYRQEVKRLSATRDKQVSLWRDDLVRVEREIRAIINAIKDGLRTATIREELLSLETRKEQLLAIQKRPQGSVSRIQPGLADLYRKKVDRLREELDRDELRAQASEIVRSLIEEIRLVPVDGRLEIEIVGRLPEVLAFASGESPQQLPSDLQITLVAGERCQRDYPEIKIRV